jgi:putative Mg2+ transporter-C (MgtC) family protein
MFQNFDFISIMQVCLAFLLGGIIGYEREYHDSPAGVRTYAAVCMGACLFGVASTHPHGFNIYYSSYDPTRIAAQVASGVGFLGAGVIFKEGLNTVGLTTAATIWASAAIGIVTAFEMYTIAILTTALMVILLAMPSIPGLKAINVKKRPRRTLAKKKDET